MTVDRYAAYKSLSGPLQLAFCWAHTRRDFLRALLGFGAAAWAVAPRDRWIGWSPASRKTNLHLVVNNARFLILPWVQSKNLASRTLGLLARRIVSDWQARYQVQPVLMETFIDSKRFRGTCYAAANWTRLGQTMGRGKKGPHQQTVPIKDVWVYPLSKDFRDHLS